MKTLAEPQIIDVFGELGVEVDPGSIDYLAHSAVSTPRELVAHNVGDTLTLYATLGELRRNNVGKHQPILADISGLNGMVVSKRAEILDTGQGTSLKLEYISSPNGVNQAMESLGYEPGVNCLRRVIMAKNDGARRFSNRHYVTAYSRGEVPNPPPDNWSTYTHDLAINDVHQMSRIATSPAAVTLKTAYAEALMPDSGEARSFTAALDSWTVITDKIYYAVKKGQIDSWITDTEEWPVDSKKLGIMRHLGLVSAELSDPEAEQAYRTIVYDMISHLATLFGKVEEVQPDHRFTVQKREHLLEAWAEMSEEYDQLPQAVAA